MRLIFTIFFITISLFSQDIRIFNIDNSNYPLMKGNIVLLNANGSLVYSPNIASVKLFENGTQMNVLNITCDINSKKDKISAVLSVDLSLSMNGQPFALAKAGAKALVSIMDSSTDEVAITGFSDFALMINDFTNNKNFLNTSIDEMFLIGGTNFNEAFLNRRDGSISIASRAQHKPIIIILTDGFANGRTQEVIDKAKEIGAVIYSVILYGQAPQFLYDVTRETGGLVFENIKTESDIVKAYEAIYRISQTLNACTITWESKNCDLERRLDYEFMGVKKFSNFSVNNLQLSSFDYPNSKFISYKGTSLGTTGRRQFGLTARQEDLVIDNIIVENSKFKVILPQNVNYPINIQRDSTFQFFVDFDYDIEGFQFSKFTISSNVCNDNIFYASGGIPAGANSQYIDIIEPNGGEVYFRGADSTIKWQANEADDKLIIEFSSDKGKNWKELARDYKGYNLNYKYPSITSNDCLVRITKLSDSVGYEYMVTNTDSVNNSSVSWQPSGDKIILGGNDGYIRVVDGFTHYNITKYYAHSKVNDIEWSPDAIRYASGGDDGKIKLWIDGDNIAYDSVDASSGAVTSLEWSTDGTRLISGDNLGNLTLWNSADLSKIKQLKISQKQINDISFSPNGSKLAVALSDTTVCILLANSFQQLMKYPLHQGAVSSLDWLNDDWIVSVSTQAFNNNVIISSSVLGQQIAAYPVKETLQKVRISRLNNLVAMVGSNGTINLWGLSDFKEKYNIKTATSWASQDLAISPDETRIVVASNGKNSGQTLKFNSIRKFPQYRTTSDSTFSLVDFQLFSDNIDFGKILIGRTKDSVVTNYITINSKLPIQIDSMRIVNDIDDVFNLTSKGNVLLFEDDIFDLNISFTPKTTKTYIARLEIFTKQVTYSKEIRGEGYKNGINDYYLDFGDLEINKSIRKQLEISNSSTDDIQIDSIIVKGPNLDIFSLIQGNTQSILKANNQNNKNLIFEFVPKLDVNYTSLAYIYFKSKDSPARIFISGRGIKAELFYSQKDTLISNCDSNLVQIINFKNTGTLNLEVKNLSSSDLIFDDTDFTIKPDEGIDIKASLNSMPSGTYSIHYYFSTNDIDNLNISNSFTFIQKNSNLEIPISVINFDNSILNNKETQNIVVKNIDEIDINWDYSLPYQINNSEFYIESVNPSKISKNESSTFVISFTRQDKLDKSEILEIKDACGKNYNVIINSKYNNGIDGIKYPTKLEKILTCEVFLDTTITIENISSNILKVKDIFSKKYNFSTIDFPYILNPNEKLNINIKFNDFGIDYIDTIEVKFEDFSIYIPIKIQFKNSQINLIDNDKIITIDNSGATNSYFVVKNIGSLPEYWNSININNTSFKITNIQPRPTLPNESATFSFTYDTKEENSISFEILDSCQFIHTQTLHFKYGNIPKLSLKVQDINGNVDDFKNIIIELENYEDFNLNDKEGISFQLSYNSTLLENKNENVMIDSNNRTLEDYELKFSDLINNKWQLENYKILWGNDSTSALKLENIKFIFDDTNKVVKSTDGLLRVLDLCQIGGTRLYFTGDIPYLKGVFPNPASTKVNIEFGLMNESEIDLEVFNFRGERVYKNKFNRNKQDSKIILDIDLGDGMYYIKASIYDKILNKSFNYDYKFIVKK